MLRPQRGHGNTADAELEGDHASGLVEYVSLVVRTWRNLTTTAALRGEAVLNDLACASCRVAELDNTWARR